MRVLAIDTAFKDGRIAFVIDGKLVAEETLEAGHLESNTFASVLKLGIQPDLSNIDLVALAAGPGSFTGLKIGAIVAKSLSFLQGKPLKGVGTLPWLAVSTGPGIILPIIRNHGNFYYWGLYNVSMEIATGKMPEELIQPASSDVEGIIKTVAARYSGEKIKAAGIQVENDISGLPWSFSKVELSLALLAKLAETGFNAEGTDDPITFTPIYVSRSQAEEKMDGSPGSKLS